MKQLTKSIKKQSSKKHQKRTDKEEIDRLTSVAKCLGFKLVFKDTLQLSNNRGLCKFSTNEIILYEKMLDDEKLFVLLHELGHILAENDKTNFLFFLQKSRKKKTKAHKHVVEITDEVMAWFYGLLIADIMEMNVKPRVDKYLVSALDSYIRKS